MMNIIDYKLHKRGSPNIVIGSMAYDNEDGLLITQNTAAIDVVNEFISHMLCEHIDGVKRDIEADHGEIFINPDTGYYAIRDSGLDVSSCDYRLVLSNPHIITDDRANWYYSDTLSSVLTEETAFKAIKNGRMNNSLIKIDEADIASQLSMKIHLSDMIIALITEKNPDFYVTNGYLSLVGKSGYKIDDFNLGVYTGLTLAQRFKLIADASFEDDLTYSNFDFMRKISVQIKSSTHDRFVFNDGSVITCKDKKWILTPKTQNTPGLGLGL